MKAASQGKDIFQLQGRLGKIPVWPDASTTKSLAFGIPGEYSYQVCKKDLVCKRVHIHNCHNCPLCILHHNNYYYLAPRE